MKRQTISLLVLGLVLSLTRTFAAEASQTIELAAPGLPARGRALELQVTTGALSRDATLVILTEQGEVLGTVAPYGPSMRRGPTISTVPIPGSAILEGRLRLRLQILEPDAPPRPPRPDEVERVNLVLVPQTE